MSLALLNRLAGNSNGSFRKFINEYTDERNPKIAWYPSAGKDFRPLLYLSKEYSRVHPATKDEPEPPELFIFSDYFPWDRDRFLDDKLIYADTKSNISVESIEELPKLVLPLHEELVDFPKGSHATHRIIFMKVGVFSEQLDSFIVLPVLYCFVENSTFFGNVLLMENASISHIIHVRHGGGLGGGGKASGAWLLRVLKLLKCQVYITDGQEYWQEGDNFVLKCYPQLAEQVEPQFETIRTIDSIKWSDHGDVSWNLVQN